MANTSLVRASQLPPPSKVKVHRSICSKLEKFIEQIWHIVLAIESARPNCALAVQGLCSLHFTLDGAKSVIQQCSVSSKLYLVITHKIVTRCEKIRSDLELYLTQMQNVVPILLDGQISGILNELRAAEFSLEFGEDEARKAILELLEKDLPGSESMNNEELSSESMNNEELNAVLKATSRLKITSPLALLEEKAALKWQLEKAMDRDQREKEKKLVKYLLHLLKKYRKFICRFQKDDSVNPQVGDS